MKKRQQQTQAKLAVAIGSTVRTAREKANLTQVDVAERVRLQSEVYGRLERGRMLPSVPTLFRLCVVLGVSSDVLLGLADELASETSRAIDDGQTPELRRVLRSVRKLDRHQIKLFLLLANALRKNAQGHEQGQKDEAPLQLEH